jgi:hypothetical protein
MKKEKLLPKGLKNKLSQKWGKEDEDPIIYAKFFYPDFGWTWYAFSFEPDDEIFYGFVDGDFPECGDFSLKELMDNRGKLGCEIERDFGFKPQRLSELRAKIKR